MLVILETVVLLVFDDEILSKLTLFPLGNHLVCIIFILCIRCLSRVVVWSVCVRLRSNCLLLRVVCLQVCNVQHNAD